jgi:hypothetical protein
MIGCAGILLIIHIDLERKRRTDSDAFVVFEERFSYPNFDHIEGILGSFVVEFFQHWKQIDNLAHFDTLKKRTSIALTFRENVGTYFRFHIGSCLLTNMKEMVSLRGEEEEEQLEYESLGIDRVTYRIEITFRFDICSEFHQSHPIGTDKSCC